MTGVDGVPGLSDWAAAGVCQEVLLRTLPSLRHDMAGLLSVARMDLALLKRWMAKLAAQGADDVAGAAERVQRVDQQFVALLQSLQALQAWGAEEASDAPSASALLEACLGWIRPMLMLGKVSVETATAQSAAPLAPVSPSAFKYLCLGALWYGVDQHGPALSRMTVALLTPGGLRVDIESSLEGSGTEAASRMPQPVWGRLDEASLRAVAQRMGWRLEVDPTGLTLWWA